MGRRFSFDADYYERFYRNPKTQVASEESVQVLCDFVYAYLQHIGQPCSKVLDLGCGLGHWHAALHQHDRRIRYHGVEYSEYLCEEYGWEQGSVIDYSADERFELVICQGVLQYLSDQDCRAAIENLAELSEGACYLEALTREDWEQNCDQRTTDGEVYLRRGDWYRRQLRRWGFVNCGGGIFLHPDSPAAMFELERLE